MMTLKELKLSNLEYAVKNDLITWFEYLDQYRKVEEEKEPFSWINHFKSQFRKEWPNRKDPFSKQYIEDLIFLIRNQKEHNAFWKSFQESINKL